MNIPLTHASGLDTVLEKVGRSLSDRFGIRVVCRGNQCATNGRTIFLPSLPDELPPEMLQVIRGYLDHEAGHLAGKSNFRIFKWFKDTYGPEASLFLNMLEDLRVEEVICQRFPGSRKNLSAAHSYLVGKAEKDTDLMPVWRQLAFGVHTRGNRQPDLPFVGPEVRQTLDTISETVLKAPRCRNTKGVMRLAEDAWSIVSQLFPPPPPTSSSPGSASDSEQSQGGQNTATSSPGNATQTANPAHTSSGTNAGTNSSAGAGAGNSQEDAGGPTQKTSAMSENSSPDQTQAEDGSARDGGDDAILGQPAPAGPDQSIQPSAGGATKAEQDSTDTADIMRTLADSIVSMVNDYSQTSRAYRVWTTEFDTIETPWNNPRTPHHRRMAKLLPHVAGVRQKLLQTLLAEPKARWLGDKENGRINPRTLHRLASAQQDNPCNGRVFRERVRTKRLHTAVTLLVDQSGSMNSTQIRLAGDTALVFCEALSRLDIPCSVVGFSTGDWDYYLNDTEAKTGMTLDELFSSYRILPLRSICFKRFHEPLRTISGRFDSMQSLNATPLGEAVLLAARELASRREERKVLFVLTDGVPAVGLGDDSATFEHAKRSIRRVEQAGIDVALVGILTNCVTDLHHRSVVVNSLDQLPKTVMRQLHSVLTDRSQYQTK